MNTLIINPTKIVFVGTNFCIYDICNMMPKHKNFPYGTEVLDPTSCKVINAVTGEVDKTTGHRAVRDKYYDIPDRKITTVIYHQTAGGYNPAFDQVLATGQFFVRDPKWKWNAAKQKWIWTAEGRGWPGFAYTWFAPFNPIIHEDKYVVFQCNPLNRVSWHTGDGCNLSGGGLAFQGYFLEPAAGVTRPMKGTDGEPSDAQLMIADGFWLEYAVPVLGATVLTGHFEHKKPACPGQTLRERLIGLRLVCGPVLGGEVQPVHLPDGAYGLTGSPGPLTALK